MESEAIGIAETSCIAEQPFVTDFDLEGAAAISLSNPSLETALLRRHIERDVPREPVVSAEWPLVAPAGNRTTTYLIAKRAVDLVGGLAMLVLLSPILLVTVLILTITTKGHPIFCQQRLGFCGRPFRMFKFRTMVLNAVQLQANVVNEKEGPIFKNSCDPRITRFGRILRSFSIDELPQLANVVLGQMSLVGPRPPLACEVAHYQPWQRQRLAVKPGLTCLWQVSGRSEIGFDRWVAMDLWYLENQSLTTDLSLLLRTPWSVITRRGAC
jgi:lipopolysaccharide/colanic/teichoic acid biosynthesis glycosyltransferase